MNIYQVSRKTFSGRLNNFGIFLFFWLPLLALFIEPDKADLSVMFPLSQTARIRKAVGLDCSGNSLRHFGPTETVN